MFVEDKFNMNKHSNTPDVRMNFNQKEEENLPVVSLFASSYEKPRSSKTKEESSGLKSRTLNRKRQQIRQQYFKYSKHFALQRQRKIN